MSNKLTPKQRLFVAEYLIDLNATKAAERAGYSPKTAPVQGSRLLSNANVAAEVARQSEKRVEKLDLAADRVLDEIGKLAFSNMLDYVSLTDDGQAFVDFTKLTREQAAAIQEIRVDETGGGGGDGRRERVQRTTFKLASKKDALELLGKYHKLFTDKHEVTGADGQPLQANVTVRFVEPGQ